MQMREEYSLHIAQETISSLQLQLRAKEAQLRKYQEIIQTRTDNENLEELTELRNTVQRLNQEKLEWLHRAPEVIVSKTPVVNQPTTHLLFSMEDMEHAIAEKSQQILNLTVQVRELQERATATEELEKELEGERQERLRLSQTMKDLNQQTLSTSKANQEQVQQIEALVASLEKSKRINEKLKSQIQTLQESEKNLKNALSELKEKLIQEAVRQAHHEHNG